VWWLRSIREDRISFPPAITIFFAQYGLWLLLAPLAWFALALVRIRSARHPSAGWFWMVSGIALAVVIFVTAVLAVVIPIGIKQIYIMTPIGRD
jgi:hypothetical protein